MDDDLRTHGRKTLDDFLRGPPARPTGPPPGPPDPGAGDDSAEAADRCGRSAGRGLVQGVILELAAGDREGVLYGAILGRVRYNPSVGISWVFEDAEGLWAVLVTGSNLHALHRELTLGRRESIRVGTAGEGVTGIEVRAWTPPGNRSAGRGGPTSG